MITSRLLLRALTIFIAAFLLNNMACSKAKFEATDPTNRQGQPSPDNVNPSDNGNPDNGDVINCSNVNSNFCNTGDDGFQDNVPPLTFTPPVCDDHSPLPSPLPNVTCYNNTFGNTTKNNVNGVNVWLVVDSSLSFDQVRLAVGRAVSRSFLSSLQHQVPVTVSVIPAHAPSSSYQGQPSYHGRFYGSSVTFNPGMSASQIQAAESALLSRLGSNMPESPISLAKRDNRVHDGLNYSSAGSNTVLGGPNSGSDEMGLSSFAKAMDNYSIPSNNAWVVMFLADENDVCVPERNSNNSLYFSHYNEQEIYNKGLCNGVTPSSVYNKARSYAGNRPFVIGTMTYLKYNTIPSNAHAQSSVGIGYTDITGLARSQGVMVDLAAAGSGLSNLSNISYNLVEGLTEVTNNSVGVHTHYPIYDDKGNRLSLNKVRRYTDNGTVKLDLQVYVNGQRSNYSYDSQNSLIMPLTKGSHVQIQFCIQ